MVSACDCADDRLRPLPRVEAEAAREDLLRAVAEALREDLPCVEAETAREDLLRPEVEARDELPRAELVPRLRDSPVLRPVVDLLLPVLLLEALLPEDDARALREREDDDRELLRALLLDRCAMDILPLSLR